MSPARICALSAAVVVALAACGADESDAPTTTAAAAAATSAVPETSAAATTTTTPRSLTDGLTGTTFESTAVSGYTLVPGSVVTLTFDAVNLGANAGCNTMTGAWSVEGDVLEVGDMVQTMMACEPSALMDQDTWLAAVLTSSPTLALDGETLTITADGATVTLQSVADQELEGVTWTAEATIGNEAVSTIPLGVRPPTLTFSDGEVLVDTGCNTGSGTYTLDGDSVTFGPIALTRMACTEPDGQQVEATVLTVLDGTATVEIDADVLTLRNGSVGLEMRAGDPAGDDDDDHALRRTSLRVGEPSRAVARRDGAPAAR